MEIIYKYKELTSGIISCFYKVYNSLGYGFLERVYENALYHELTKCNFIVEKQKPIKVIYDNIDVGEYYADLVVNDLVILEQKLSKHLCQSMKIN